MKSINGDQVFLSPLRSPVGESVILTVQSDFYLDQIKFSIESTKMKKEMTGTNAIRFLASTIYNPEKVLV